MKSTNLFKTKCAEQKLINKNNEDSYENLLSDRTASISTKIWYRNASVKQIKISNSKQMTRDFYTFHTSAELSSQVSIKTKELTKDGKTKVVSII